MSDPACPSCGVHYGDHQGLISACAALREARAELADTKSVLETFRRANDELIAERDEARRERDEARSELARLRAERPNALREWPGIIAEWTATCDSLRRERDEARAKVAATWLEGVAEGRRCATLSAAAEAEERARALLEAQRERTQLLAWLRRPVDAEEATAWLAERGIHAEGLQKRFDGGDACWTDGRGGIVAHDWRISAARWAIADAIESGEPLSQPAPTAPK